MFYLQSMQIHENIQLPSNTSRGDSIQPSPDQNFGRASCMSSKKGNEFQVSFRNTGATRKEKFIHVQALTTRRTEILYYKVNSQQELKRLGKNY